MNDFIHVKQSGVVTHLFSNFNGHLIKLPLKFGCGWVIHPTKNSGCGYLASWSLLAWWRHQMKHSPRYWPFFAGNSPVTGEFPAQRPVTRKFDAFFDLSLNKRLSKQSWSWWCETLSRPLWRHSNGKWDPLKFGSFNLSPLPPEACLLVYQCTFGEKISWTMYFSFWWLQLCIKHYGRPVYDNDNDNENMFITIDLHVYKIQDARYKYTENKHQTSFFFW